MSIILSLEDRSWLFQVNPFREYVVNNSVHLFIASVGVRLTWQISLNQKITELPENQAQQDFRVFYSQKNIIPRNTKHGNFQLPDTGNSH